MTVINHYYLIDMENVGLSGLCGLNMPGEGSAIILFISNNAHVATEEVQEDILNSKAEISTFFCSVTGKNAMDFELASFFGSVLEKPETKRVSIISQDGGYKSLEDYARKARKNVTVYQGRNILEAFVAEQNMAGPKMYAKGKQVDFKHVMEALQKKRDFEDPIRSQLAGIVNSGEMDNVIAVMKDEASPKQKYLSLLKMLGRVRGTEAYRIVKGIRA